MAKKKKKKVHPVIRARHGDVTIVVQKKADGWYHNVSEFHGPYRSSRAALEEAAELVDLANS